MRWPSFFLLGKDMTITHPNHVMHDGCRSMMSGRMANMLVYNSNLAEGALVGKDLFHHELAGVIEKKHTHTPFTQQLS